jgi:hypothetical protein
VSPRLLFTFNVFIWFLRWCDLGSSPSLSAFFARTPVGWCYFSLCSLTRDAIWAWGFSVGCSQPWVHSLPEPGLFRGCVLRGAVGLCVFRAFVHFIGLSPIQSAGIKSFWVFSTVLLTPGGMWRYPLQFLALVTCVSCVRLGLRLVDFIDLLEECLVLMDFLPVLVFILLIYALIFAFFCVFVFNLLFFF